MKSHYHIIIAGAGGIAEAAALILTEWSEVTPSIFIGNRTVEKAEHLVDWIQKGSAKKGHLKAFHLVSENPDPQMVEILKQGDIILDCLPGSVAPKMAKLAKEYHLHYVNLTEYVDETEKIIQLASNADTGFVLQSGLAPGYIGILAHGLFNQFIAEYSVDKVDQLEMKVGALTDHAVSPHYYGFTWSPVGVATEYLKDAIVLRNFEKTTLPSLSEQNQIVIDGVLYEDNLTSGGAADLPDALEGSVCNLDYKTLRHPGHYGWVRSEIDKIGYDPHPVDALQERMEAMIPHLNDDHIIIYAAVQGKDKNGILRRKEIAKKIRPQQVGNHRLRAIQTTTVVPMLQSAVFLLENQPSGVILQSQLNPLQFLEGSFIKAVYGESGLTRP